MSEIQGRQWRFYLDDMIEFAEKAIAYTEGFDQARFVASGLTNCALTTFFAYARDRHWRRTEPARFLAIRT